MSKFIDYSTIVFSDTQTNYKFEDTGTEFVATKISFLSDISCYVRFTASDSDQILIRGGLIYNFSRPTKEIWVMRVGSIDGTLEVWAEGDVSA